MVDLNNEFKIFDMDDFIQADNTNKVQSVKHLRKANYWTHFENLSGYYHELLQDRDHIDDSHEARLHYFSNCSINFIRGINNTLGGHFTDSSIFIRRTVEAVRYAAFLRDNADIVKCWGKVDLKPEFDKKFKKWFPEGEGKNIVEAEFPKSAEHYKKATTYGPHSNHFLFAQQHIPTEIGFKILYTEIENSLKGYHNVLSVYFWHLSVHAAAINWWIHKSGFKHRYSEEQLRLFSVRHNAIEADYAVVMQKLRATTHQAASAHNV